MKNYIIIIFGLMLLGCNQQSTKEDINYDKFKVNKTAKTPPMGWNSWDVFGTDVTEDEVKAMADYMAEHLKPFGYEYIVVDLGWYAPNATAVEHQYHQRNNAHPHQIIDGYGRLIPAPNRFPSCKNGFKPLADYVHSKGLKFGIHVMRGIPIQAVEQNTPIKGSNFTAQDVFSYQDRCVFYSGMYSLKTNHPGAMQYYQSLLDLYAEWGVDFIKSDDMARYPKSQHLEEFILFRKALENTGRPMTLSLSPGGGISIMDRGTVNQYADMFRISGDFWDEWSDLKDMFSRCRNWQMYTGPGSWADCDMIPLGIINIRAEHGIGERKTLFTIDEQYTLMTLWSVFRSPLMLGMDLTRLDDFTLSLLTNKKVIEINQHSTNNKEIYNQEGIIVWRATSIDSTETYLAVFNTNDNESIIDLNENLKDKYDFKDFNEFYDIWTADPISYDDIKTISIEPHGAKYIVCKHVGSE